MSGRSVVPASRPWQDTLHTSSTALNFLLSTGMHSDVTLVVGRDGRQFKVHRLILAMRSPVFEEMLMLDSNNRNKSVIVLKEDSPQGFQWLLQHVYTDKTELDNIDLALQVLGLSDKYMVAKAYDTCIRYIQTVVKRNNVLKLYKYLIHLFPENDSLRSICRQMFEDNGNAVLISSALLDLTPEAMSQLLQENLRVTSESVILKALVSWGNAQLRSQDKPLTSENLRQQIGSMLPDIRFCTMTSDDFVNSVVVTDVLTPEETVHILKNIARPETDSSSLLSKGYNLNTSREGRASLITKDQMRTCVCEDVKKQWLQQSIYEFNVCPSDNIVLLAIKLQLEGGTAETTLEIRKEDSKSSPLAVCETRGNNVSFRNPVHLREAVNYVVKVTVSDPDTHLYGAKFATKTYETNGFLITISSGVFVQALVFI